MLGALTLMIVSLLSLSACDDAWWFGTDDIEGTWIIDQIDINTEYRSGDTWTFGYNGRFYAEGDGGLYQNGDWMQDGNSILIRFDNSYSNQAELVCSVIEFYGDSMELFVTDYGYNETYRVILVRSNYYAKKK